MERFLLSILVLLLFGKYIYIVVAYHNKLFYSEQQTKFIQQKRRSCDVIADMSFARVTYGKYVTWVPDVVVYEFYECFFSMKYSCPYNKEIYTKEKIVQASEVIHRFIATALFRIWSGAGHTHHTTLTNDRKDSKAGDLKQARR